MARRMMPAAIRPRRERDGGGGGGDGAGWALGGAEGLGELGQLGLELLLALGELRLPHPRAHTTARQPRRRRRPSPAARRRPIPPRLVTSSMKEYTRVRRTASIAQRGGMGGAGGTLRESSPPGPAAGTPL